MLRKWNKSLAFLLAVVLVFTSFGTDFTSARAAEGEYVENGSDNQGDNSELWEKIPETDENTETGESENSDDSASEEAATEATEVEESVSDASTEESATEASSEDAAVSSSTEESATEASSEDAAASSSSEDAASLSSSNEDAASESSSEVVEEKLVTVRYKATLGGKVSKSKETVDINDKEASFEGSTASAKNKYYQFTAWKNEDGEPVSYDSTFVPADVTEDTTFTAYFEKLSAMPAQDFAATADNMNVNVHADEGIFPEGTTMSVSAISDTEAVEAAKDALGENVTQAKGVDITFRNSDGEEIEPADSKYVHVSISLSDTLEGESFSVVHKDDEGNASKVAAASADGAEFDTNSFSVYIVAGEEHEEDDDDNKAVCTYTFYYDGTEFNVQRVKKGDTLVDPGIPTLEPNEEFFGWYTKDSGGNFTDEKIQFGEVMDQLEADSKVDVYAKIQTTYYLTYKGVDGEVARVDKITVVGDEEPIVDLTQFHVTPKKDTQAFVGWSLSDESVADREVIKSVNLSELEKNNRIVYAVVVDAIWISFDENDDTYDAGGKKIESGGADYTGPIFVKVGDSATKPSVDPTRPGYNFAGWYTGKGDKAGEVTGELYNWSTKITEETTDFTLYAKWEPKSDTQYTVVIWQQKITDDKNTTKNEAKTYDYKTSFTESGVTGTKITVDDTLLQKYAGHGSAHFHVSWGEVVRYAGGVKTATDEIRAKGDTVINVYFDRDLMTINFFKKNWTGKWVVDTSIQPLTGLFGQTLAYSGCTWPKTGTYMLMNTEYSDDYVYLDFLDTFIFDSYTSESTLNVYKLNESYTSEMVIHYYKEQLDGSFKEVNTVTHTSRKGDGYNFWCDDYYTGFTPSYYTIKADNYTKHYELKVGTHIAGKYPDDIRLYFKRNTYEVEFYDNFEGTITKVTGVDESYKTVPYEAPMNDGSALASGINYQKLAPTLNDRPGYKFAGWYLDTTGAPGTEYKWNDTMPAANKVLYAHYEKIKCKVTLITHGGTYNGGNVETEDEKYWFNVEYGDPLDKTTMINSISKEGEQFVGWFMSDDNNAEPCSYAGVFSDITLYAKWRNPGTVNVIYDATPHGSGEPVDTYSYATDSSVVVSAPPTDVEEKYTFIGWQIVKDGKVVSETLYPNNSFTITKSIITKDADGKQSVILKAVYEKTGGPGTSTEETKLTYHSNDGKGLTKVVDKIGDDPLRVNQTVTALTLGDAFGDGYKRAGYEFLGWSKDASATTAWLLAGSTYSIAADNKDDSGKSIEDYDGNNLYAVWKKIDYSVKIYIKGNNHTDPYDATEHTTTGWTVSKAEYYHDGKLVTDYEGPEYSFNSISFTGKAEAKRTDVGTTQMGIDITKFSYTGTEFVNVEFILDEDGYQKITPIPVTVKIIGAFNTTTYDGAEHKVNGYSTEITGSTLYKKEYISFTGKAEAKRTEVGKTLMNLTIAQFSNTNNNFDVTFDVTDGYQEITPVDEVVVTIIGNKSSVPYDGKIHTISGYTVQISNKAYKEEFIKFTGTAKATRTDSGKTMMGLTDSQFSNINSVTFKKVTFQIKEDGYQEVTPITAVVKIEGNTGSDVYDAAEHTTTGYNVVSISTPLYTANDFTFSGKAVAKRTEVGKTMMELSDSQFNNENTTNFSSVTFDIVDGYQEITPVTKEVVVTITGHKNTDPYNGSEYTTTGYDVEISDRLYLEDYIDFTGTDTASQTNVGTSFMGLNKDQFVNTNKNFDNVTFVVKEDGYQKVTPIEAVVEIEGSYATDVYDGLEHSVEGYDVVSISTPLYSEDDFTFSGEAKAARTEVGKTMMGLTDAQFSNTNANFSKVTFVVTDGYQEITPTEIEVTVKIKGHQNIDPYNGSEYVTTGYDVVEIDCELYDESYIKFNGTAKAARTDVGLTTMGLKPEQFENTNKNFSNVTFVIDEDGSQEVTPITAVVEIFGSTDSSPYNGKEHVVTGYTVKSISTPLYTEDDFTFSGKAEAARTDVGKTMMGLTNAQFSNTNANFSKVDFVVIDGYQEITPITAVVNIAGNFDVAEYDGEEHVVTGYEVTSISTPLYTEDDFTFSGKAEAARTEVGTTDMGLTSEQFTNTNANFSKVDFVIVDGYQQITPVGNVVVTITGHQNTDPYNGQEFTTTGFDVEISNKAYKEEYIKFNGSAKAARTDVGTTNMGLEAEQFENTNDSFKKVTFVIRQDGYQEVTPIKAVVNIAGNTSTEVYDGKEHVVTGYEVTSISTPLYTEEDFTFTGEAKAARTDVGITYMELDAEQFTNNNENFSEVEFVIEDGYQEITPLSIIIEVVGNTDTVTYDGKKHEVTGYELTIPKEAKDIYDESYVTFKGEAKAEGIAIDTYPMGLDESQFGNTNENVIVERFDVTDGWLKIVGRGDDELFVIKATTDSVVKDYSGLTYSGFDYKLSASAGNEGPVTTFLNAVFGRDADVSADGDTVTIDGAEFKVSGLHVDTAERNVGEYTIAISGYDEMVITDVENNDVTSQFTKLEKSEGTLTILPIDITVTSATDEKVYDGTPLTNHNVKTSIEWCPGDVVSYRVTGSQTEVGSSSNTFDIVAEDGVLSNYNVTKVEGTLTVTTQTTPPDPPTPDPPTPDPPTPNPPVPSVPSVPTTPGQEVLGARREPEGQAVLGARRANTEDKTNDLARLFAIIVAAIVAVGLLLTSRKKEEEK